MEKIEEETEQTRSQETREDRSTANKHPKIHGYGEAADSGALLQQTDTPLMIRAPLVIRCKWEIARNSGGEFSHRIVGFTGF